MKKRKQKILISFLLNNSLFAQINAEIKAKWVFNVCHGIEWENEDRIKEYKMSVLCSDDEYLKFNEMADTITIKGRKVILERCLSVEGISNDIHILYYSGIYLKYGKQLLKKFNDKSVLIISDKAKNTLYSVINFLGFDKYDFYEINEKLLKSQSLKIFTHTIRMGL